MKVKELAKELKKYGRNEDVFVVVSTTAKEGVKRGYVVQIEKVTPNHGAQLLVDLEK